MSIVDGEISARVRIAVEHVGLPLRQLSATIGVSAPFLSQVQTGRHPPSLAMLIGLRRVYGISIDWLLVGAGEMVANDAPVGGDARLARAVRMAAAEVGAGRVAAMLESLAGDQLPGVRSA